MICGFKSVSERKIGMSFGPWTLAGVSLMTGCTSLDSIGYQGQKGRLMVLGDKASAHFKAGRYIMHLINEKNIVD